MSASLGVQSVFQNSLASAALSDQLTPKQPSLTGPELLAAPDGVNLLFVLENTVMVLDENKNPGNARSAPPSPRHSSRRGWLPGGGGVWLS